MIRQLADGSFKGGAGLQGSMGHEAWSKGIKIKNLILRPLDLKPAGGAQRQTLRPSVVR
jgi:hypothetical protein